MVTDSPSDFSSISHLLTFEPFSSHNCIAVDIVDDATVYRECRVIVAEGHVVTFCAVVSTDGSGCAVGFDFNISLSFRGSAGI